jgi:hypothetical protein
MWDPLMTNMKHELEPKIKVLESKLNEASDQKADIFIAPELLFCRNVDQFCEHGHQAFEKKDLKSVHVLQDFNRVNGMLSSFSSSHEKMLIIAGTMLHTGKTGKNSHNTALVYRDGKAMHFDKHHIVATGATGGRTKFNEMELMKQGEHEKLEPESGPAGSSGQVVEDVAGGLKAIARICHDQSVLCSKDKGDRFAESDILLVPGLAFGDPVCKLNYKSIVVCDGVQPSSIYFGGDRISIGEKGYHLIVLDINNKKIDIEEIITGPPPPSGGSAGSSEPEADDQKKAGDKEAGKEEAAAEAGASQAR